MSEQLDTVERMAKEALADLQREYQLRAQPYIDILCKIEALKPPSMLVSYLQWEQIQKNPPPVKEREKSRRSD